MLRSRMPEFSGDIHLLSPLTRKQRRVLDLIRDFVDENGYSPSVRELGELLGLAPATVQQHLDALQTKGYIDRTGAAHGVTLAEEASAVTESIFVPIVGTIAAGEPILAFEENEGRVTVPGTEGGSDEHFALRVQGDSMIDDHILDGDIVVIRRQQTAENGDVVVALLEGGTATLKRLYRDDGRYRLQPANAELAPVFVDRLDVQGIVTGIVRQLV